MMVDHYELAAERIYRNASRICEAYQQLWGDDVNVRVYRSMHDTDAPNAVALLGYPTDLQTTPTVTGYVSKQQFTIRCYIRTTHSDESLCCSRASHLAEALQLMANADPKLGYTVEKVEHEVPEWQFGTDNQKMTTCVVRIDFKCTVVTQNMAEIAAILAADEYEEE